MAGGAKPQARPFTGIVTGLTHSSGNEGEVIGRLGEQQTARGKEGSIVRRTRLNWLGRCKRIVNIESGLA